MDQLDDEQAKRETAAVDDALGKYRDDRERQSGGYSLPGRKFLRAHVEALTAAIKREQDLARKRRRPWKYDRVILYFAPDKLALLTLRAVLNATWTGKSTFDTPDLSEVVWGLANACANERRFSILWKEDPDLRAKLLRLARHEPKAARRAARTRVAELEKDWIKGNRAFRLALLLVVLAKRHTSTIVFIKEKRLHQEEGGAVIKTPRVIALTEETKRSLITWDSDCEALVPPVFRPMIQQPVPWTRLGVGGYLTIETDLVRHHNNPRVIKALKHADLRRVFVAVNALQGTPWRINHRILEVAERAWDENASIPKFPRRDQGQSPPRALGLCADLRDKRFYFPYYLDFRGRAYPTPPTLHPQSDDLTRALLVFADAEPLGETGKRWLALHLANMFGLDKKPYDARLKWVEDHEGAICDSTTDPLEGDKLWRHAKKPWSFLAAAIEWAASRGGGPDFESNLPIVVDGTCNGLQHLSAVTKDFHGGESTNLVPDTYPHDIYGMVRDDLRTRVKKATTRGKWKEEARWWRDRVERETVKRATMTTPYNVTLRGIWRQLVDEGFVDGVPAEDRERYAKFLARRLQKSIGSIVVGAKEVRRWLNDVAEKVAAANGTIRWTLPTGFPVVHDYRAPATQQIRVLDYSLDLGQPDADAPVKVHEFRRAIVANFVHSLDAAHMMMTVERLQAEGVQHFFMVHDTYGVHACHMDRLSEVLREEFVKLHEQPLLENFLDEQRKAHRTITFAPPPGVTVGPTSSQDAPRLILQDVLKSQYFFT